MSVTVVNEALDEFGPVLYQAQETAAKFTLATIDAMEGSRQCKIRVLVACPKKPGSIAEALWPLYDGQPTVAEFLARMTASHSRSRARASLLWDLQRRFVQIVQ
jgi:hypothetical protein